MSDAVTPTPRSAWIVPAIGAAAGCVAVIAVALLVFGGPEEDGPLPAPGLGQPVELAGLVREAHLVVPMVLASIYGAFSATDEGVIYDGLSSVSAGDALEALYLERAGALASGGLPDQKVHEIRLISGSWRAEGDAMHADIRWAVLGQVGHDEHTHMRGNAYGAELVLAPVDGAWRLTDFTLTDVDRSDAGTIVTVGAEDEAGGPASE